MKFTVQGGRRLVHTKDEVYYEPDNLERLEAALLAIGQPFERADRGSLIDITKVVEIDEKKAIAYFEGNEKGTRGNDTTLSRPDNFNRIRKRFRELLGTSD